MKYTKENIDGVKFVLGNELLSLNGGGEDYNYTISVKGDYAIVTWNEKAREGCVAYKVDEAIEYLTYGSWVVTNS